MGLPLPQPSAARATASGLAALAALLALVLHGPAAAQTGEGVGRVISQVGEVIAVGPDGERRSLERRSAIHEGDTVVIGESGRAQVRFKDEGLVDLKAGTRFAVARYRAQAAGDDRDSAVMELIEGGMRTLTGAVGGGEGQQYRVDTPVASIGIRGTQYVLRLCQGDCGDVDDGLYGGVSQGRIGVANAAGERAFGGDRYFRVASRSAPPQGILAPPGDLLTGRMAGAGVQAEGDGLRPRAMPRLGAFLNPLAAGHAPRLPFLWQEGFEAAEEVDRDGQPVGTREVLLEIPQ